MLLNLCTLNNYFYEDKERHALIFSRPTSYRAKCCSVKCNYKWLRQSFCPPSLNHKDKSALLFFIHVTFNQNQNTSWDVGSLYNPTDHIQGEACDRDKCLHLSPESIQLQPTSLRPPQPLPVSSPYYYFTLLPLRPFWPLLMVHLTLFILSYLIRTPPKALPSYATVISKLFVLFDYKESSLYLSFMHGGGVSKFHSFSGM